MSVVAYVVLIVLVNYGFSVVPLVALPTGEMWPPMSLAVGLVFVVRDFAQRAIGHWILAAMVVAGILSWYMADPFIAVASVAAFAVSETSDWLVYSYSGRSFRDRVLLSSAIGTPVDSVVFLALIGHLSLSGVLAMTASKMVGAVVIWSLLNRRSEAA